MSKVGATREDQQDAVAADYAAGRIDRATARDRLILLGLQADIVDEGLDETPVNGKGAADKPPPVAS